MTNQLQEEKILSLTRIFNADPDRVYEAWTNPEHLAQWWGPPGSVVKEVNVDLKVGGAYRIGFEQPDGALIFVGGAYHELQPPQKLVFTWQWENPEMDIGSSLVTLNFQDQDGKTELVLTHEQLPEMALPSHKEGWVGILSKLEPFLQDH